ncbi:MAG: hypothetical protein HND27_07145 [Bacteroidetes bacterium]|nr:hypothetical protein [Bacteroidota bacterium]NOG95541.1 hypothetical protein [Bacteroidota bacterium]
MKEKHLEFVQGVINRMGQNSFLIKGWAVTLVSALFALAAKDTNQKFVIVAYFPTIIFWLLDSYFLYQERLFRRVYDHVRQQTAIDFSLNTKPFDKGFSDWAGAALSKTILLFYGVIMLVLLIVMYYLNHK